MTAMAPFRVPHQPIATTDETVLQVRQLVKIYPGGDRPALNGIDLTVCGGEIFGLLGPNGAGKTTAIAVLSTLLRPTSGRVTLCGLDIQLHIAAARRWIGVVPQHIALYESLSARENLMYFGRIYGLQGAALTRAVSQGLQMTGLSERAHDPVKILSGGMKRRINLAAGILHRPSLLFLDEPTVGVDAQSRNLIFENLLQLKNQGMAMIYTTHYFEEAELLCPRVAILDEGRILAQGECRQLIAAHTDCVHLSDVYLKLTGRQLRD